MSVNVTPIRPYLWPLRFFGDDAICYQLDRELAGYAKTYPSFTRSEHEISATWLVGHMLERSEAHAGREWLRQMRRLETVEERKARRAAQRADLVERQAKFLAGARS